MTETQTDMQAESEEAQASGAIIAGGVLCGLANYLPPSVSPVCPRSFAAALRKAATNASSSVGARSETAA
jgi:hypothetical protein